MKILSLLLSSLFLSMVFFYGCSEDPTSTGADLLKLDKVVIKTFNSLADSGSQISSSFQKVNTLGSSSYILLGRTNQYESQVLLKFEPALSDYDSLILHDSISISSAEIVLTPRYKLGDTLPFTTIQVQKILSGWTEESFTSDSLSYLRILPENLTLEVSQTDSLYKIKVAPALAKFWLRSGLNAEGKSNYGVLLNAMSANPKVVGFEALTSSSSYYPKLTITFSVLGSSSDTSFTFYPSADLHVVTGHFTPPPSDEFVIQSGVSIHGKLWFDLSKLPKNIIVNSASLQITPHADSTKTVLSSSISNYLKCFYVPDSLTFVGSSVVTSTFVDKDSIYISDITSMIARYVSNNKNANFLIVNAGDEYGLDKYTFYSSSVADLTKRPLLKINYSLKP